MIHTFKINDKEFEYQYVQSGRIRLCTTCHKLITSVSRMDHVKCYEKKKKIIKKKFDIQNYIKKRKDNEYEGYLLELQTINSKSNVFTKEYIEKRTKFLTSKINEYEL